MKKLLAIAAFAVATTGFAADQTTSPFQLWGGVGANTNYQYRGESFSSKHPSVDGQVGLKLNAGPVNVFGAAELHSISTKADNTRVLGVYEVGVGAALPFKLSLEGGFRQVAYYGNTGVAVYKARDLGYQEVFVRGTLPTVTKGWVTAEYNRVVNDSNVTPGHDSFYGVGYQQPITSVLTVGATANWKYYDRSSTNRFNNFLLNANYKVTDKVSLYALQSFGGKYDTNVKLPNLTTLGVALAF